MPSAINPIHPPPYEFSAAALAADPILRFFHYTHLPPTLQAASAPFCGLAVHIVTTLPRTAERTVALRKLLEAKDAAVRSNVPADPAPLASGSHVDRMKAELAELRERAKKLNHFIGMDPRFLDLTGDEQHLMIEQRLAMDNYLDALSGRITLACRGPDLVNVAEELREDGVTVPRPVRHDPETPIPFD